MNTSHLQTNSASAGALAAIVASLCCITPVFSFLAGIGGIAATFSWMEPLRPYLIALTVGVLGFAWYIKLRPQPKEQIDCECNDEKPSFWQTKKFLSVVTLFAGLMLTFPSYSYMFYPTPNNQAQTNPMFEAQDSTHLVTFKVKGMTCAGCEAHIENTVSQLEGVKSVDASFANGAAVVEFLSLEVTPEQIVEAINNTGYQVVEVENVGQKNEADDGEESSYLVTTGTGNLSFFKVPLVCAAASHLGCGSRSKPVLLAFENSEFVQEAWLNKKGDVMAIVWKGGTDLGKQREVVNQVFANHKINASELLMDDYAKNFESFSSGKGWYKGEQVNELSQEEAGIFAERFLIVIKEKTKLSKSQEAKLREKAVNDMYDFFLNFKSIDELGNPNAYKKIINNLIAYGESEVGKGTMPTVDELWAACSSAAKSCSHDSCTGGACKIPKG